MYEVFKKTIFVFFISIFILLTRRKRQRRYTLGRQLSRSAFGDAKVLLSACNLTEIGLKFGTACKDHQARECA